ncbi:hypothetical protein GON03_16315 [Nocardioides sp. MAH-18]|uniref:Uncharacterized protein n=1 Tax=Nocardioides agri TaxID=2682843 RepID=A0A6L6XU91_9ACTN|nr:MULTISPECIES: hypothetical protein [unclassified Nocardioides]MBA2955901.1 hypothetical protein [Nocardioides sp. CGMCC 1.13656]MVQ50750.1 hypothetical protein [Nocardioides sp. MAH-18]
MAARQPVPREVKIRTEPRRPEVDPTLGIPVAVQVPAAPPTHRLVTVGDSLTHGFMSGAIHRTDLSWPAITAFELGLTAEQFRFPTYEWPSGPGGLPLDLERLAREFARRFGNKLDLLETFRAGPWLRDHMDAIEDYWERGKGAEPPADGPPFHNTAIYGWDVLDVQLATEARVEKRLAGKPHDDFLKQLVENHAARAARPVLHRAAQGDPKRTVLDSVAAMADDEGVETLVVVIGANNALGSILTLEPSWTPAGYAKLSPAERLDARAGCNLWRPSAFKADWADLVAQLQAIKAQHVVIATVPSVTIAPIARGTDNKVRPDSRYFPYYTRPWITDEDFDPEHDPHLTEDEVRAIDSAIDAYNETIIASVRAARTAGQDWYLFDMGGLLDRLATRRYINSPWARPAWWQPYPLPAALQRLDPVPNTRFFRAGPGGRTDGGLFSLDGVHPTTVAYGILAQEVIKILQLAGVEFLDRQGNPRSGPVQVDFDRLLRADTLLSDPPISITGSLGLLGWLDDHLDWVTTFLPFVHSPL